MSIHSNLLLFLYPEAMPLAATSCHIPSDEDLKLSAALIAVLILSSAVCMVFLLFYTCYCIFRQRYNSRIQRQNQDIEQGLSSQQQQQRVTISIPEDKVKQDPEASKFKNVSWTAFKQDIITNKSRQHDDDANKASTCVICFEEFRDGDECRVRSKCNHIFHRTCIGEWLDDHATCPLCRGRVPPTVWHYVTTVAYQSPD